MMLLAKRESCMPSSQAWGLSVAYGRYEIAIILSTVGFLILQFSEPFKVKKN